MKEEWDKFTDQMKECTREMCGMRCVGGRGGRRVNGGVRKWCGSGEKRRAFKSWLQRRHGDSYDKYRAERAVME